MSTLLGHVEDYLRLRRALGDKLERAGDLLPKLVGHLEAAGSATLTTELAISWARLPANARPNHWAARRWIALEAAAAGLLFTVLDVAEVLRQVDESRRRHPCCWRCWRLVPPAMTDPSATLPPRPTSPLET